VGDHRRGGNADVDRRRRQPPGGRGGAAPRGRTGAPASPAERSASRPRRFAGGVPSGVESGEEPETSGRDNLGSLGIVLAMVEAIERAEALAATDRGIANG
jgi:hypothetical protein